MDRVERFNALCRERIDLAALSAARFGRGEPAGSIDQRLAEITAELDALNVTPKERAAAVGLDGRAALSQMQWRAAPEPLDGRAALRQMERRWRPP
jgi:hypothetical protein